MKKHRPIIMFGYLNLNPNIDPKVLKGYNVEVLKESSNDIDGVGLET